MQMCVLVQCHKVMELKVGRLAKCLKSSVFCGREEILLVQTSTPFKFQDLLHAQEHITQWRKGNKQRVPFPSGSSMVPANGIIIPETRSVWHPSTGTLKPDPIGSGYSIPSRAGRHISEPGRGISPGLNSTGGVRGCSNIYSSIPASFYVRHISRES